MHALVPPSLVHVIMLPRYLTLIFARHVTRLMKEKTLLLNLRFSFVMSVCKVDGWKSSFRSWLRKKKSPIYWKRTGKSTQSRWELEIVFGFVATKLLRNAVHWHWFILIWQASSNSEKKSINDVATQANNGTKEVEHWKNAARHNRRTVHTEEASTQAKEATLESIAPAPAPFFIHARHTW